MGPSMVTVIQEHYCDCVSFGIMPNMDQEILSVCCFQTTLVHLFYPLIVSIRETEKVLIRSQNFPLHVNGIKICQILQKKRETALILLRTLWHPLKV